MAQLLNFMLSKSLMLTLIRFSHSVMNLWDIVRLTTEKDDELWIGMLGICLSTPLEGLSLDQFLTFWNLLILEPYYSTSISLKPNLAPQFSSQTEHFAGLVSHNFGNPTFLLMGFSDTFEQIYSWYAYPYFC